MRNPLMHRSTHDREVADLSNALKRARADARRVGEEKDTLYDNNQRHLARIAELERDIAARDLTHRGLAEERDAALETVGILATDGDTDVLRRVVVDHIATNLRSPSSVAADLARALQSELWLAGVGVDADVKTALDGAS
jgi:hypothetical protein